jgi:hypothetical protein
MMTSILLIWAAGAMRRRDLFRIVTLKLRLFGRTPDEINRLT